MASLFLQEPHDIRMEIEYILAFMIFCKIN